MRLVVAVALIPVLAPVSAVNRSLLKAALGVSPLPEVVAQFADRLPEAVAVLDFLELAPTLVLPALPA